MAKVNRRSGMVSGSVGDTTYRRDRGKQILEKKKTGDARTGPAKRHRKDFTNFAERAGCLPHGLKGAWGLRAAKYSAPASELDKHDNVQKSKFGLKIISHIYDFPNFVSLYEHCNQNAMDAGFEYPCDFPPYLSMSMPLEPDLLEWRYENGVLWAKFRVPAQFHPYNKEGAKLALAFRGYFGGTKIDGRSRFRAYDQVAARARITKTPCEVELSFDQLRVNFEEIGKTKIMKLTDVGLGVLAATANVIGGIDVYWGKVPNSNPKPAEPKEIWASLLKAQVEKLRAEGKLKDGPLYDAVEEDDFVGGRICGAWKSLNSDYIHLTINDTGEKHEKRLKSTGSYFKNRNKKNKK